MNVVNVNDPLLQLNEDERRALIPNLILMDSLEIVGYVVDVDMALVLVGLLVFVLLVTVNDLIDHEFYYCSWVLLCSV